MFDLFCRKAYRVAEKFKGNKVLKNFAEVQNPRIVLKAVTTRTRIHRDLAKKALY